MEKISCPKCNTTGLGERAIHTTIKGKTIFQLKNMYIKDLYDFLLEIPERKSIPLYREIIINTNTKFEIF